MLFDGVHGKAAAVPAGRVVAGLSLVGVVLFCGACEPTAFIATNPLSLQAIHSPGAVGAECTETSPDVKPVLRFTLRDTNGDAVFPGDELRDYVHELGVTFTPDNLDVHDNLGVLFPAPDVDCVDGAAIGSPCPDALLADAGFTCQPLNPSAPAGDDQARVVCAYPDLTVEVGPNASIEFVGGSNSKRAIIVLVTHGSSVLGLDDEGIPDRVGCSTDPFDRRARGLTLMLRELGSDANRYVSGTELCLGTFTGQGVPTYRYPEGTGVEECFQPVRLGSSGFNFLDDEVTSLATTEEAGGRNPWGALEDAIAKFDAWAGADFERHIVLVTDGEVDAGSAEFARSLNHTYEAVLQDALAENVIIHVAQFDRRDRAADCTPETTHGASDDFSRIACATGGNFAYVEDAQDLPGFLENVGRAVPAHYEIELLSQQIALFPLGPYKLHAIFSATVAGKQESVIFSASGAGDTRIPMLNRGDCADRDCLSGYVCDPAGPTCDIGLAEVPDGSGEGSGEGSGAGE